MHPRRSITLRHMRHINHQTGSPKSKKWSLTCQVFPLRIREVQWVAGVSQVRGPLNHPVDSPFIRISQPFWGRNTNIYGTHLNVSIPYAYRWFLWLINVQANRRNLLHHSHWSSKLQLHVHLPFGSIWLHYFCPPRDTMASTPNGSLSTRASTRSPISLVELMIRTKTRGTLGDTSPVPKKRWIRLARDSWMTLASHLKRFMTVGWWWMMIVMDLVAWRMMSWKNDELIRIDVGLLADDAWCMTYDACWITEWPMMIMLTPSDGLTIMGQMMIMCTTSMAIGTTNSLWPCPQHQ